MLTESLLEYETLDGKHVHEILEHGELKSEVIRPEPPKKPEPTEPETPEATESKEDPMPPGVDPAQQPA